MNQNIKVQGGISHIISQLNIKQIIDNDYADHLRREINYGRITGFRHLAELLLAYGTIGQQNYSAIIEYSKRFGTY
jgi:hypothetical protein